MSTWQSYIKEYQNYLRLERGLSKNTIDNYVVLEIKRELISNIPIKEIAYKFGFIETTNFIKYFKKQTNISPSKFKEQLGL